MKTKHIRKIALTLALFILLQPFAMSLTIIMEPVAAAESEEDEEEERKSPRPGVRNADDRSDRASNFKPGSGGSSDSGINRPGTPGGEGGSPDGGSGDPTGGSGDPTGGSGDPTEGSGDPTGGSGDPTGGGGDPTGGSGDPTGGGGDPTGGSGDPTRGGVDPTGGGGDPNGESDDPTGRNSDPTGRSSNPNGESGDPTGGNGDPTGENGEGEGASGGPKEVFEFLVNTDEVFQSVSKTNSPIGTPGARRAVLSNIELFDDEKQQIAYEDSLRAAGYLSSLHSEVGHVHRFRTGKDLVARDWLTGTPYQSSYQHMKHISSTNAYVTRYYQKGFKVYQDVRYVNEARHSLTMSKAINPVSWMSSQAKNITTSMYNNIANVAAGTMNHIDKGLQGIGRVINSSGNWISGVTKNFANEVRATSNIVTSVKNTMKSAPGYLGMSILDDVSRKVDGVISGFNTAVQTTHNFTSRIAQTLSDSNLTSRFQSMATTVGNFVSNSYDKTRNIMSTVSNSRVGNVIKGVASSPIGRAAGGILNGYVIADGYNALTGSGPINERIGGAINIGSGVLGIGAGIALFAGATAIAPALIAGAAVTGLIALGVTYGPQIVNGVKRAGKWVGEQGRAFMSDPGGYVSDVASKAKDTVSKAKDTVSNALDSGKNFVSGLFGG
ncbi:hypothetical protein [Alteribacter populi]|uniref:hypothetical protein n=1 Tax=Alteribacter populi TaxID=2011011 RepID=UPI000BBB31E5|nr:hypothetical protein [Alteribacter populi]